MPDKLSRIVVFHEQDEFSGHAFAIVLWAILGVVI